jgi:hypothetical protein
MSEPLPPLPQAHRSFPLPMRAAAIYQILKCEDPKHGADAQAVAEPSGCGRGQGGAPGAGRARVRWRRESGAELGWLAAPAANEFVPRGAGYGGVPTISRPHPEILIPIRRTIRFTALETAAIPACSTARSIPAHPDKAVPVALGMKRCRVLSTTNQSAIRRIRIRTGCLRGSLFLRRRLWTSIRRNRPCHRQSILQQ